MVKFFRIFPPEIPHTGKNFKRKKNCDKFTLKKMVNKSQTKSTKVNVIFYLYKMFCH